MTIYCLNTNISAKIQCTHLLLFLTSFQANYFKYHITEGWTGVPFDDSLEPYSARTS